MRIPSCGGLLGLHGNGEQNRAVERFLTLHGNCSSQEMLGAGLEEEFLFIGRLDNLAMSFLSLQALIDSTAGNGALADEAAVKAIALFDHEEVGSASAQGEAQHL